MLEPGGSGSLVKGIGDHSRGTGIQDGRSGNQMCDPRGQAGGSESQGRGFKNQVLSQGS